MMRRWMVWVAGAGWIWSALGLALWGHLYAVAVPYGVASGLARWGAGMAGVFFILATGCTGLGVWAWRPS
jgi:hypothetical protein